MLGWTGGIHPKVREYYVRQFLKSTGKPLVDEDWYLAAYFAGIHARRQLAISVWSPGEVPLKIAFLRYPDGSQKEKQNALQISQHPLEGHGSSHQHISPWASITGVSRTQNGSYTLTVLPVRSENAKKPKGLLFWSMQACVYLFLYLRNSQNHIYEIDYTLFLLFFLRSLASIAERRNSEEISFRASSLFADFMRSFASFMASCVCCWSIDSCP